MKSIGWKDIAESVGVIAIVASLLFVGLQLQQDKRLTRAELGSFAMEFGSSVSFGMSDPEVAHVWAKMLDNPQDLSSAEMVQVDGILRSVRTMMMRECYLLAMEVFGECESTVRGAARTYFSNEYAQAWWRHYHGPNPYGTADFINNIVTGVDATGNRSFQEKVQSEL
jgi:hypothetical protein